VDTGVDRRHADLATQLVPGRDFVSGDDVAETDPRDGNGHGTHVTGTIVAAQNGVGISGVAPEARAMALRVLDDDGRGTAADVAAAFAHAGRQGVRIVNASLGSDEPSRAEQQAIAASPGTLFVVAAGNDRRDVDAPGAGSWPCSYALENVLCVGASTGADAIAEFSNRGTVSVDLLAPGFEVLSSALGGGARPASGTSMAAPHVAGAAALVAAQRRRRRARAQAGRPGQRRRPPRAGRDLAHRRAAERRTGGGRGVGRAAARRCARSRPARGGRRRCPGRPA
jgi:thermitase